MVHYLMNYIKTKYVECNYHHSFSCILTIDKKIRKQNTPCSCIIYLQGLAVFETLVHG